MDKLGYLKLIIGCMFSSKSTNLLSEINRISHINKNILVINHSFDKKRTKERNIIKTHDNKEYPALFLEKLKNLIYIEDYVKADYIFIDEGQFYPDLYCVLEQELKNTNKHFYVAGLSGSYLLEPLGDILKLIPLADDILKLSAYCIKCNGETKASFTKLIKNKNENMILVGDDDLYISVCRYHYYNN